MSILLCQFRTGPGELTSEIFEWIVKELNRDWGIQFFVISGGEPFMWRDNGITIMDIAERNRNCLFLVFTNGTLLLSENRLDRLIKLGNILPAISVEGLKEKTELRRGKGVFKRIIEVMENLKNMGIAFGISITATRENCKEVLSDAIDFYFKKMGASFAWIFHYMPIGRHPDTTFMPEPEQRLWMWERSWKIIRQKKFFIADFWNHGTVSSGCISAAKPGEYFYIDWNGNIMPCVFFPYTTMNINEIYKRGGRLDEIFMDPFFKGIKNWQRDYGADGELNDKTNWLMPCPIRGHHFIARKIINKYGAKLCDGNDKFMDSSKYIREMEEYDRRMHVKIDKIWNEEYIRNN